MDGPQLRGPWFESHSVQFLFSVVFSVVFYKTIKISPANTNCNLAATTSSAAGTCSQIQGVHLSKGHGILADSAAKA